MSFRTFLMGLGVLWSLFVGFIACVMLSISPMLAMAFDAPGSTGDLSIYGFIAAYFLFIVSLIASIPLCFRIIRSATRRQTDESKNTKDRS